MSEVNVKFRPQFEMDLLMGRKYATTRTKRLGQVGDEFVAFGQRFELTHVEDKALFEVATEHFHEEGFDSKEGFISIWETIHPKVGYQKFQRVYYHEFKFSPMTARRGTL